MNGMKVRSRRKVARMIGVAMFRVQGHRRGRGEALGVRTALRPLVCLGLGLLASCGSSQEDLVCGPGTVERDGVCVGGGDGPDAGGTSTTDGGFKLPSGAYYAFVTRTTYPVDLGGKSGAYDFCGSAARAAGLEGGFTPWLSIIASGANDAIETIFADGPWYTTAGALVFANKAALMTSPQHALDKDEFGQPIASPNLDVWTGTAAGGTLKGDTCSNWQGSGSIAQAVVGRVGALDGTWTDASTIRCDANQLAHLYCFGGT